MILGSCRNDGDRAVLERTRALAVELGVEERVEFVVNCSFDELKAWLGRASVGLHTMWNEHFGIGVVEMMVGVPRRRSGVCLVCFGQSDSDDVAPRLCSLIGPRGLFLCAFFTVRSPQHNAAPRHNACAAASLNYAERIQPVMLNRRLVW